ncbi:MAG TPA: GntR family transcriptional regulator [Mycobacteriales bacterium]|nr:GntR family transcriptional regulator [Mycobacteriales bacterium]
MATPATRDSTARIHRDLRAGILMGEIPAGSSLAQAHVAQRFGVSRGPVREAFRLLQREGLIDAEVNRRARVASFSAEEVEQLYSLRVVTESLAIGTSVPRFTDEDLAGLGRLLDAVDAVPVDDLRAFERAHLEFHQGCLRHGGERTLGWIEQWSEHTERYRRVYVTGEPQVRALGAVEHREILAACLARDPTAAASLVARHLARAALTMMAMMSPEYDPALIRAALRQVTAGTVEAELARPSRRRHRPAS